MEETTVAKHPLNTHEDVPIPEPELPVPEYPEHTYLPIDKSSIIHINAPPDCFPEPPNQLTIKIRTKKDNVRIVYLLYGDPYDHDNQPWKHKRTEMELQGSDGIHDYWEETISLGYRRYQYEFEIVGFGGDTLYYGETGFRKDLPGHGYYFRYPMLLKENLYNPPDWVRETVWYQIFVERFANGDDNNDPPGTVPWGTEKPTRTSFFGGDLRGIIDKIPYLRDLGINGVYLTPIFHARSNHKYDTVDYLEIDPQFGNKEEFKELVTKMHENGIKVMLDCVFNHSGEYFMPFQDVVNLQEKSSYKDWFNIYNFPITKEPRPNYDTFGYHGYLPKLNTSNPPTKNYLLDVAKYWIEKFDIDAWRLDVANEVDGKFWRLFKQETKTVKKDLFILGEIWHNSMPWLHGDQHDSTMNYPLLFSAESFVLGKMKPTQFSEKLVYILGRYPRTVNTMLFNMVGSHDIARVLTRLGGDKKLLRILFDFSITFPGTFCLYYGDEIGMEGGDDPDCRRCMIWDESQQDTSLKEHVKKLIILRKSSKALATGNFKCIEADDDSDFIMFQRRDKETNEKILMMINLGENPVTVKIKSNEMKEASDHKTVYVDPVVAIYDILDVQCYDPGVQLNVAPKSTKILQIK